MNWPSLPQSRAASRVVPNLFDYEKTRAAFSWESIRAELSGLPGGGLNIGHEAVDRQAAEPLRDRVALRWLSLGGEVRDFTYRATQGSRAPKEIEFQACLPKTRSGKIMRRLLKARELDLPEGDISTLEKSE